MFNEILLYPESIATMGPSIANEDTIREILLSGCHNFRFNMSHADPLTHRHNFDMLKSCARQLGITVSTFADLSGPKIRLGEVKEGMSVSAGDKLYLTTEKVSEGGSRISVTYKNFPEEVEVGMTILVDDGRVKLTIIEIIGAEVRCEVLVGGDLSSHKGVNVPEADFSFPSLTEKDKIDTLFALSLPVDAIALSFVRDGADVKALRSHLHSVGFTRTPIISKLETRKAMSHLKDIIHESDALMVARGDLAVEVDLIHVPLYQKEICKLSSEAGKPVIVATQMLESMTESSVPTRAEVSDAMNAVFDGASYLMLSDETTFGKYPVHAVKILTAVAKEGVVRRYEKA